ncbi:hypothetical protein F0310_01580 [Borrelia sp. A-FGy1]|uniref:hypothetical protein n=1 Tax=Borrelia sp. A-FGy1 TaxID=2608247 RepID=UPI0015F4BE0F|nr:hypothetical protein [Borrelia sp. A-FGy1]QMU99115.1 hypothetical protein F0310_01580 [Borrelia sp. A-FGy1]
MVPDFAFLSKTRHIIGRGGGFYGIFLQRGFFLKVGVCFDFRIFNFVTFCSDDIKLGFVLSGGVKVFYFCE